MIGRQWLNAAAVATWLVAGANPLLRLLDGPIALWPGGVWGIAFAAFGAAMAGCLFRAEHQHGGAQARVWLIAVQAVSGVLVNYLSARFFGGTGVGIGLFVLVAAQLPYAIRPAAVWTWIVAQTVALAVAFIAGNVVEGVSEIVGFSIAIGAFQLFAAASSILSRSEGESRERLAAANAELHATRAQLAERSRVEERLRISRDLHDTLGHHLTALSLQLDVAARISEVKAGNHIRQAHAITKLLLADVRDVVGTLRDRDRPQLGEAVRAVAVSSPGLTVHLEAPDDFGAIDPGRADALLRAVQEIITNASRHARASNLWIRLDDTDAGITLHARDDGRGVPTTGNVVCGNGLTGMRERFAEHAGHVEFVAGGAAGFEVRGFLPRPV
jgi:signal transduction histidine kinase